MRLAPRRKFEWTRLLGLGLVIMALVLVTDPDYPIARGAGPAAAPGSSASRRVVLMPSPLRPRGRCAPDPEFAWSWRGPAMAWRVAVLDANLEEIWAAAAGSATTLRPGPELLAWLQPGAAYFWRVVATGEAPTPRSAPASFSVRAELAAAPDGK